MKAAFAHTTRGTIAEKIQTHLRGTSCAPRTTDDERAAARLGSVTRRASDDAVEPRSRGSVNVRAEVIDRSIDRLIELIDLID